MNKVKEAVAEIKHWMSAHPYKSNIFTCIFTILACSMGGREDWMPVLIPAFGLTLMVLVATMHLDMKKLTVLFMIGSLLAVTTPQVYAVEAKAVPEQAEPDGGGGGAIDIPKPEGSCAIAAAIVVIVVGGYAIYKLRQFCQRKFPKTPPPPPKKGTNNINQAEGGSGGGTDTEAASWNIGPFGSCPAYHTDDCNGDHTQADGGGGGGTTIIEMALILDVTLYEDEHGPVANTQARYLPEMQDTMTFSEAGEYDMEYYNLPSFGDPGEMHYSKNGRQITGAESSIQFDTGTPGAVRIMDGKPQHRVVLERSSDLLFWTRLGSMDISAGRTFSFVDHTRTVSGQMFYRSQVEGID